MTRGTEGLKLAAAGTALGVALALVVTRLMEARLFQIAFAPVILGQIIISEPAAGGQVISIVERRIL